MMKVSITTRGEVFNQFYTEKHQNNDTLPTNAKRGALILIC
ncbi:hypothetical protein B0O79_0966 [Flavobacteriaceae bacterium MAR_2009_75]|nr:hypothetical protein B0O79_0966 [Flavobacteriaceae bacterium MAR_2009_75]